MAMRATTVRLGEDVFALLEHHADALGVTPAQLIRDATLMRLAALAARDAPAAVRDPARLAALRDAALLDTPAEESFDRLARLTAKLLRAPVALISLVDAERQFFKSCVGLPWTGPYETPLSHSICQHTVGARQPLVLADARRDPRLRGSGALRDLGVVAYLGAPLIAPDGHALGALCAIDARPRDWTADEVATLVDLAGSVIGEVELRARRRVRR